MLYLTLVLSTEHNIFGDFFFQNRRNIKTRKSSKVFKIQPKKEIKDITRRKTTKTTTNPKQRYLLLLSLRNRTPAKTRGQQNACV